MRAVVQRVSQASVTVDGKVVGALAEPGLLVLPRRHPRRRPRRGRLDWPARSGTCGSCATSGPPPTSARRCWWSASSRCTATPARAAARPGRPPRPAPVSEPLYDAFCAELERLGARVERGVFGADMQVELGQRRPGDADRRVLKRLRHPQSSDKHGDFAPAAIIADCRYGPFDSTIETELTRTMTTSHDGDHPSQKTPAPRLTVVADEGDDGQSRSPRRPEPRAGLHRGSRRRSRGSTAAAGAQVAPRRGFFRRHLALVALVILLVAAREPPAARVVPRTTSAATSRGSTTCSWRTRSAPQGGDRSAQHLLGGSDNGDDGQTVAEDVNSGPGRPARTGQRHDHPGAHPGRPEARQIWSRSPATPGCRSRRPGDTAGKAKINAAFSLGRPHLPRVHRRGPHRPADRPRGDHRLERLQGPDRRLWRGRRSTSPRRSTTSAQNITWHKGWQTLKGKTGPAVRPDPAWLAQRRLRPDRAAAELPA